jgi:hypothetical protein
MTKMILTVLAPLSLAGDPLIALEAKLRKAMPLGEVRLVARINMMPPGGGIDAREVEKT